MYLPFWVADMDFEILIELKQILLDALIMVFLDTLNPLMSMLMY